jgi:hypothetical protein
MRICSTQVVLAVFVVVVIKIFNCKGSFDFDVVYLDCFVKQEGKTTMRKF